MNITKGNSPDPVPSWLEDVDDESASRPAYQLVPPDPPRFANRVPATTDGRCARQR